MGAYLFHPAPAFFDHQIGRRLTGSTPTSHCGFRKPCPFRERKRSLFASSCQGFDVAASHNEPIAAPPRRQPPGPDPPTDCLSGSTGQEGRRFDVQFVV
jgi:hypothetical protein